MAKEAPNISKARVMAFDRSEYKTECNMLIGGKRFERVKKSVHFNGLYVNDIKHGDDIERKVNMGNKEAYVVEAQFWAIICTVECESGLAYRAGRASAS
ncbi:hypothetical protein EVAR_35453_1 [Eumeta japonica]|uniref:Uncharacterized protein n=1 Tax=Eumeta variegata TaxID=151549 RepID=A0A4C1XMA2_EUMVA|nr:hypothetical protein EVAR_35453_1 [Eumeta japonica]